MRCTEKVRYSTRKRAIKARSTVLNRFHHPAYVYRCPLCNGWHLTSQTQRTTARRAA